MTLFYFIFGEQLILLIFGTAYREAAPLLGWMGFAMIGVSLSSIWLNFYLAQEPRDFVILLGAAVVIRMAALKSNSAVHAKCCFCIWCHRLALNRWRFIALSFQIPSHIDKSVCLISLNFTANTMNNMEDFWSRRVNAPKYKRTIRIFGHPVIFDSNHPSVLDSATMAEQMYSTSDFQNESTWRVHLTVHDADPIPAPPPKRLVDLVHFAGADDWLSMDMREWGNCFADMKRGEAHVVLSSSLADQPEQICLVLLNTILTNFVTRHGYSMLHASALVKDDHILLLQAPHGTGKSTTALRLILNGYKLLSDSMVYIGEHDGELWMGGFPVGRIKLRSDMLHLFPELAAEAQDEPVRDETKHRVELNRVDPELTFQDDASHPSG